MQRYKIRTLGKKYGLDRDDLYSYDPQTRAVSYDGRLLTVADDEVNGVSYKNSEKDFLEDVHDWHKSGGDELVAVRDYVATSGSRNGYQAPKVDFEAGEGRVLIGGSSLKPSFISEDGRAYAPKSRVDAILDRAVPAPPVYEDRFSSRIERAESRLNNRSFSYDPEEDPAYRALREQYRREGDRALTDTAGRLAALTGGRISSAAAAAGAQARMQYAEKLNDNIPELAADAYARYRDGLDREERALDRLYEAEDTAYARYNDSVDRYNRQAEAANESAVYREEQLSRETKHQLDLRDLSTKTVEEYQKRALIRGHYTAEEAEYLGVPKDASPWATELKRAAAMSDQEFADYLRRSNLDTASEKELIDYRKQSDLEKASSMSDLEVEEYTKKADLDKANEKELIDYREQSANRQAQYKASLNPPSTTSNNRQPVRQLTRDEAEQRLTQVMAGNAQSGMPYLYALQNAIEKNHPMLMELGVSYGLSHAEVQKFLDDTYATVHQQILYHEKQDAKSWALYGNTLWGR